MSISRAVSATVLTSCLITACSDPGPTVVDLSQWHQRHDDGDDALLAPEGTSFQRGPGQMTAGQIPTTISRTGEYQGTICGIVATATFHEAGTEWPAPFGHPVRETGTFVTEWTNPDNGHSVELRNSGQVTRAILEVYPDGSFRVRETYTHGVKLSAGTGAPLTFASGHIVFEFVVVPLPGGRFTLTDVEVVFVAGPHPDDALSESPGFCELVETALL